MPYGISAQSVLGAGGSRAAAPREDGSTANSQLPGARKQKQNHFGGEARATSTTSTFAGAMRALLKPTPTPAAAPAAAAAAAAAPTTHGAERVVWQPRSALDASGHSFSKTLKAEISRSKQQRNDPLANGSGSNNGWWDGGRLGGGGLDDSMVHAPPPQSRSNLRGTPRVPMATGRRAGAPGGIPQHQHHHQPQQPQQRQQQQQQQQQHMSVSMRRPKSYRDQCLDEISRAVGLQ